VSGDLKAPPSVEDFAGFRRVAEFYLGLRPEWEEWLRPALAAMTSETDVLAAFGLLGAEGPGFRGEVRNGTTMSSKGITYTVEMPGGPELRPGDMVEVRVIPGSRWWLSSGEAP
jgi:hypothetical protein